MGDYARGLEGARCLHSCLASVDWDSLGIGSVAVYGPGLSGRPDGWVGVMISPGEGAAREAFAAAGACTLVCGGARVVVCGEWDCLREEGWERVYVYYGGRVGRGGRAEALAAAGQRGGR